MAWKNSNNDTRRLLFRRVRLSRYTAVSSRKILIRNEHSRFAAIYLRAKKARRRTIVES